MEALTTIHQLFGYIVALVILGIAISALVETRETRPFTPGIYVIPAVALDLQVVAGLVIYVVGSYWEHASPLMRYFHPLAALLALAAGHAGIASARRADGATGSHRRAGVGLLVALLFAALAIGFATAGLRGVGA